MWSAIWWPIVLDLNVLNQNSTILTQEMSFNMWSAIWWPISLSLNVLNQNSTIFTQENEFQYVVCNMVTNFPRPQCVKSKFNNFHTRKWVSICSLNMVTIFYRPQCVKWSVHADPPGVSWSHQSGFITSNRSEIWQEHQPKSKAMWIFKLQILKFPRVQDI